MSNDEMYASISNRFLIELVRLMQQATNEGCDEISFIFPKFGKINDIPDLRVTIRWDIEEPEIDK